MKPLRSLRLLPLWPILAALASASLLLWLLIPTLLERSAAAGLSDALPVVGRLFEGELGGPPEALQARVVALAEGSEMRITVVRGDGLVLADSARTWEELLAMDNHAGRPEVRQAFALGQGSSVRRSATTGRDYVYAARRLNDSTGRLWVLRLARPLRALRAVRGRLLGVLAVTITVAAVTVSLVWWGLDRRLYRPLGSMIVAADRVSHGRLAERLPVPESAELGPLAAAVNRIAERAQIEVGRVEGQRNRLRQILSGMSDGVLVVDASDRVTLVNPAFRELFGIEGEVGERSAIELVRRPAVAEELAAARAAGGEGRPADGSERLLQLDSGRSVALRGQPLAGGAVLLVAQDVTARLNLDRTRRDFVANVSHELRTPLTAIRGYAENLSDGALGDPAAGPKFIERILGQCRRLEALLEDLLSLARLEKQPPPSAADETVDLAELAGRVIETARVLAGERAVELELEAPAALPVRGSSESLETMLGNLVDNAVKYNRRGGSVTVRVGERQGEAEIEVADTGLGIPAAELTRIFERFYRVDRGRGRGEGGTGLGLAIVKHAAQQLGGRVEVESRIGVGSTFRVRLPVAPLSHGRRTAADGSA